MLSVAARWSSAGDGGEPPTKKRTGDGQGEASSAPSSMVMTVGAAQACVTPSEWSARHTTAGSTAGRQTWRAPVAVTAHAYAQPLQWNIGSVHRYALRAPRPASAITPRLWRYAPRCDVMTPLGSPVVPDV